jgi:type 1 glutamine amidotransferase
MGAAMQWIGALFCAAALSACAAVAPMAEEASAERPRVLVFTHSTGYRHASIEPGIAAFQAIGAREGYVVSASEDPDIFSAESLADIDAIVLICTTSSRRNPESEWFQGARGEALQAFVHRGGAIVGVHAAADSHYNWPWYRRMIGAAFTHHPPGEPPADITIVDGDDPSTRALPAHFTRADEWYYYTDVDANLHMLATYDPLSIGQEGPGPNPISWNHEFEGGRVFYTGMGHTPESYQDELFLAHISGGLKWALGLED